MLFSLTSAERVRKWQWDSTGKKDCPPPVCILLMSLTYSTDILTVWCRYDCLHVIFMCVFSENSAHVSIKIDNTPNLYMKHRQKSHSSEFCSLGFFFFFFFGIHELQVRIFVCIAPGFEEKSMRRKIIFWIAANEPSSLWRCDVTALREKHADYDGTRRSNTFLYFRRTAFDKLNMFLAYKTV